MVVDRRRELALSEEFILTINGHNQTMGHEVASGSGLVVRTNELIQIGPWLFVGVLIGVEYTIHVAVQHTAYSTSSTSVPPAFSTSDTVAIPPRCTDLAHSEYVPIHSLILLIKNFNVEVIRPTFVQILTIKPLASLFPVNIYFIVAVR